MRTITITLGLVCILFQAFSQTPSQNQIDNQPRRLKIGMTPFRYDSTLIQRSLVDRIESDIRKNISNLNRVILLDSKYSDALSFERNRQKSAEIDLADIASQGKGIGARYLIVGNVIESRCTDRKIPGVDRVVKVATLSYSLSILDVETGQIIATETFNPKSAEAGDYADCESALAQAVRNARDGKLESFIKDNFEIICTVKRSSITVKQLKKQDVADTFLIYGGAKKYSFDSGEKLYIYSESIDAEGDFIRSEYATLKVVEDKGEFTLVKCVDLEGKVKTWFDDPNSKLVVTNIGLKK